VAFAVAWLSLGLMQASKPEALLIAGLGVLPLVTMAFARHRFASAVPGLAMLVGVVLVAWKVQTGITWDASSRGAQVLLGVLAAAVLSIPTTSLLLVTRTRWMSDAAGCAKPCAAASGWALGAMGLVQIAVFQLFADWFGVVVLTAAVPALFFGMAMRLRYTARAVDVAADPVPPAVPVKSLLASFAAGFCCGLISLVVSAVLLITTIDPDNAPKGGWGGSTMLGEEVQRQSYSATPAPAPPPPFPP